VITWCGSKKLAIVKLTQVYVRPINEHIAWILKLFHHLLDETNIVYYTHNDTRRSLNKASLSRFRCHWGRRVAEIVGL